MENSLKLRANDPENQLLEDDSFPFGARPIFRGYVTWRIIQVVRIRPPENKPRIHGQLEGPPKPDP